MPFLALMLSVVMKTFYTEKKWVFILMLSEKVSHIKIHRLTNSCKKKDSGFLSTIAFPNLRKQQFPPAIMTQTVLQVS